MKLESILFIFFIASILLVFITIEQSSNTIYSQQIKKIKANKIQILSEKTYPRTRKVYVPERSLFLARQVINNILFNDPIRFELNDSSYLKKSMLIKIVKIINHVQEDVVLSISVHTDSVGTSKHNLYLSQKRADRLKEYFINKTNLPLVVAIGYGEEFSLKSRLIKINLKRIKQ